MRSVRAGFVILVLITLVGCADPGPEDTAAPSPTGGGSVGDRVLTVPQAIKAGDQAVKVRGYILVRADGVARLCTGLAGSYPPQCGSPSLVVKGLRLETVDGRESAEGVTWTGETTLRGTLAGGVLTVT